MKRRTFILSSMGAGLLTTLALKPSNSGAPYSNYFNTLNQALKRNGAYRPTLLIDLNQLDKNIDATTALVNPNAAYRVVVKSVPSPDLLKYVMTRANTNKLMVFHQPFLNYVAEHFQQSDVLMGKPMPVKSAAHFYRELSLDSKFDHQAKLQWLIDSQERLEQYLTLAKQQNISIRVNIEIDVGLHRGGLTEPAQLDSLLALIDAHPEHLEFSGFMGYDPQVVKFPPIIKSAETAYAESQQVYQSFLDRLRSIKPAIDLGPLCLNGAGSPTLAMHQKSTVANDLSAGSCLVMPSDFDIPTLAQFQPACFIATPVLKNIDGTHLPGLERFSAMMSAWNPNRQQTYFIYGGKWMANYESPQGLTANSIFGESSNQQIVNGSSNVGLHVDDHVFLRPHQSEAVFLHFGALQTFRGAEFDVSWAILNS